MMHVTLKRIRQDKNGTFGILYDDAGKQLCVTCEEPWNYNSRKNSCIPAGRYRCERFSGSKFKNVWQVVNVPNRDTILIHNGNTIADTEGCILVGKAFSALLGQPSISESKLTLEQLRSILDDEFEILITDDWRK